MPRILEESLKTDGFHQIEKLSSTKYLVGLSRGFFCTDKIKALTLIGSKIKTMSLQTSKISVAQKVLSLQQETLVRKIDNLIEQERIVGYTVDGQALTKGQYNQRIAIAEKQLQNGEAISQEELEQESENW